MFKRMILFLFFLDFNWGQCDPNNDGQLNEMDIIEHVNCIIDNCFDGSQCDFNSDGYLDIFDICATVDCIQVAVGKVKIYLPFTAVSIL